MKRPMYILGGVAGMIGGALMAGWEIFGSAFPFTPRASLGGHNFTFQSALVCALAVCIVSAWFVWRSIGPRR